MKAVLSNFKQSPRKVRLVADVIRGKSVRAAREQLAFLAKKSAPELAKLLESAIANARLRGMHPEGLIVKSISVDKGIVMKRFKPMARGRAARVNRTRSIIRLELGTVQDVEDNSQKAVKKIAAKSEAPKKPAAKKKKAKTSE